MLDNYITGKMKKVENSSLSKKFSFLNGFEGFSSQKGMRPVGILVLRLLCICLLVGPIPKVYGIEPSEVIVVANDRMAESVDIASYYMEKRHIPKDHLLTLSLTLKETMKRSNFDKKLRKKVVQKIKDLSGSSRITTVVLIYGIPLKIKPPKPSWDDLDTIRRLEKEIATLRSDNPLKVKTDDNQIESREKKIDSLLGTKKRAAVDSELSLALVEKYELNGWVKNPYFLGYRGHKGLLKKSKVLLVSRLDGPDPQIVYRVINDSLYAEKNGLQGVAYFDARWKEKRAEEKGESSGYQLYDSSIHEAAKRTASRLQVVIDDSEQLFTEQSCPDAALYCGWYSLGKYIDSFSWVRGAIGYHIASSEAASLRDKGKSLWCLKMLEKGVAATIGPVYEPYVQGFPLPEIFFGHLIEGYMSIGEAYLVSQPFLSWQTVLIGDPLYRPFSPR